MQAASCLNFNHCRANVPVRFCPNCGEVVSEAIPAQKCSEDKHAQKRREQNKYCTDCGDQLISD